MLDRTEWSRRLRVVGVSRPAAEVLLVELEGTEPGPLPRWTPGAHIDLRLPSGLIRQYSLCGDPGDRHRYRIAVLRVPDGRGGSVETHRVLVPGATVDIAGPRNRFALVEARTYLFLAGGIGITPIAPMIKQVAGSPAQWRAVYGARTSAHMAFGEELAALNPERVDLWPQDARGLPDVARLVRELPPGAAVYCCGPAPMLEAVERACAARVEPVDLHIERFAGAGDAKPERDSTTFEVELRRSGVTLQVPADRSILDVVIDNVGDVPFSCEEGVCGTCETAVLAGVPEHRDELLSAEERATNATMMICVGRSRTPRLVLDL